MDQVVLQDTHELLLSSRLLPIGRDDGAREVLVLESGSHEVGQGIPLKRIQVLQKCVRVLELLGVEVRHGGGKRLAAGVSPMTDPYWLTGESH